MKSGSATISQDAGWLDRTFSPTMNRRCDRRVIMHPNTDASSWDDAFYAHPHPPGERETLPASRQRGRALVHGVKAQTRWAGGWTCGRAARAPGGDRFQSIPINSNHF